MIRLGVNVDHVATLRNARGETYPDPVTAAQLALANGADGITAHLREDRRHIKDADLKRLRRLDAPLNFEMAPTDQMIQIACDLAPHAVCLVPERREELTTEGGLDLLKEDAASKDGLALNIRRLQKAGIRVSLFVDPAPAQLGKARDLGADCVELHTGAYAQTGLKELERLQKAAALAVSYGLEVHAGHGLTYDNVGAVAAFPEIRELNIGHFLISRALFEGLGESVRKMKALMLQARNRNTFV